MSETRIIELMKSILERQNKNISHFSNTTVLKEIGFRSLDFSELCLRVEEEEGKELNFDAAVLRKINSVNDVVDFIISCLR